MMLWESRAEEAVIRSFRAAMDASIRARRKDAARTLAVYEDDWAQILEDEIDYIFDAPANAERAKKYSDRSFNLLRWIVRKVGAIYDKPPMRSLGDSTPDDYLAVVDESHMDMVMQQACRLTVALGETFVRPGVREDSPGQYVLAWDVLTPDVVEVKVHPDDPLLMVEMMYEVWTEDPVSGKPRKQYVFWDANRVLVFDDGWNRVNDPENPDGVNPYGVIPWVPLHREFPVRAFWQPTAGDALRNATLRTALALTDLNHAFAEAGYRQIVLSGRPGKDFPERQIRDIGQPLLVGDGTATTLDSTAPFRDLIDAILAKAGMVANMMGVRPSAVRGEVDASSGYALRLKEQALEEERNRLRRTFAAWELEIYRVLARVWNVHRLGPQLPEDADFSIEWADVGPSAQPKELSEMWGQRVRDGLATREQALQALYGLDEGEAADLAQQIRAQQMAESPIPTAPPADSPVLAALRKAQGKAQ